MESSNYLLTEEIKVKDKRLADFEQKILTLSNVVKTMQDKIGEMGEEINKVK